MTVRYRMVPVSAQRPARVKPQGREWGKILFDCIRSGENYRGHVDLSGRKVDNVKHSLRRFFHKHPELFPQGLVLHTEQVEEGRVLEVYFTRE